VYPIWQVPEYESLSLRREPINSCQSLRREQSGCVESWQYTVPLTPSPVPPQLDSLSQVAAALDGEAQVQYPAIPPEVVPVLVLVSIVLYSG